MDMPLLSGKSTDDHLCCVKESFLRRTQSRLADHAALDDGNSLRCGRGEERTSKGGGFADQLAPFSPLPVENINIFTSDRLLLTSRQRSSYTVLSTCMLHHHRCFFVTAVNLIPFLSLHFAFHTF